MPRRFFALLLLLLLCVPIAHAQDGLSSDPLQRARLINDSSRAVNLLITTDARTTVNTILAPINQSVYFLPPGAYEVALQSATDFEVEDERQAFTVREGDVFEIIVYETPTDDDPELHLALFELNALAGHPIDFVRESPWLYMNLLTDTATMDVVAEDAEGRRSTLAEGIGYEQGQLAFTPFATFDQRMYATDLEQFFAVGRGYFGEPYYSSVRIYSGEAGDDWDIRNYPLVNADLLSYLHDYNPYHFPDSYFIYEALVYHNNFDEVIAAATDTTFIVPTDAAFAEMGTEALGGLLNDAEALTTVLSYHAYKTDQHPQIVTDRYVVETLAGTALTVDTGPRRFELNGVSVNAVLPLVGDGVVNTLVFVDRVLFLSDQPVITG